MTQHEMKSAIVHLKHEKKMVKQKYSRLVNIMEKNKDQVTFDEGSSTKQQLAQAITYIESDWNRSKLDVMKMIVNVELDHDKGVPVQDCDRDKFVSHISESIKNISLKLQDKSSQCRFSTDIVNISMSLYMKSKAAYSELRSCNLLPLPSKEVLKRHLSVVVPTEGIDPMSMLFMKDICEKKNQAIEGHLMMDEIKLKNGIMWNCMNNVCTGFIAEDLNTSDIMNNILGLNKDKHPDKKQISVYANQWRF